MAATVGGGGEGGGGTSVTHKLGFKGGGGGRFLSRAGFFSITPAQKKRV